MCWPGFTADSAKPRKARRPWIRLRASIKSRMNWRRCDGMYPEAEVHRIPEATVSSGCSLFGRLRESWKIAGCTAGLMSLTLTSLAQTAPAVEFKDITEQSKVNFTQENSATSNK